MSFDEVLEKFGKILGVLKRSYAEEFGVNPYNITILIDEGDTVTIIPTLQTGNYVECTRKYVDTDN